MTRSYKPARIERHGYQPKKPGGTPPRLSQCPIIGKPLEWLEDYNKQFKPDAK